MQYHMEKNALIIFKWVSLGSCITIQVHVLPFIVVARDDNRARRDQICLPISIITKNFYFYLGPSPMESSQMSRLGCINFLFFLN